MRRGFSTSVPGRRCALRALGAQHASAARVTALALAVALLAACGGNAENPPTMAVPTATHTVAVAPSATATVAAVPSATRPGENPPTATSTRPAATATATNTAGMCAEGGSPGPTATPVPPGATTTPTCPVTPPPDALGQYGSIIEDAQTVLAPITLPPYALTASGMPGDLPASVVLTNLPAVATQGTPSANGFPGSCEAQAFGYDLGSYTAARTPEGTVKWNPAEPDNQVSAAFLFALAQAEGIATCGKGKSLFYLERLITSGAPSAAEVPYQPYCCYFDAINPDAMFADQSRFLIGSFTALHIPPSGAATNDTLELLKRLVAAGHAIAFSGPVFEGYSNPQLSNGVFGSNTGFQPLLIPGSGHAQFIVGYDDQIGDPAAPGAFLVQNSFGPCWPPAAPGGQIWWAYQTFLASQALTAVAYPVADAPPTGTQLQSTLSGVNAYVTQVNHWVDPLAPQNVYLIAQLQFSAPLVIDTIMLTEPDTGTVVQQSFGEPMANGYAFFERTDGHQFVNGSYGLTLAVTTLQGPSGQFSGSIAVGASVPTTPTPAPIATPIYGTNGARAAVLPGS